MEDEILERNKNLNRGFRKLRAPVKYATLSFGISRGKYGERR